jgi:hypothetical protein
MIFFLHLFLFKKIIYLKIKIYKNNFLTIYKNDSFYIKNHNAKKRKFRNTNTSKLSILL